jgi:hypothetical protein
MIVPKGDVARGKKAGKVTSLAISYAALGEDFL